MNDGVIIFLKQRAVKWFIEDISSPEEEEKSKTEFDCWTMPQFMIDIKSKVPLNYLRYVDWKRMVSDSISSKQMVVLFYNQSDNDFRYITNDEASNIDGNETWMFVIKIRS
jgi:hypothetical protein